MNESNKDFLLTGLQGPFLYKRLNLITNSYGKNFLINPYFFQGHFLEPVPLENMARTLSYNKDVFKDFKKLTFGKDTPKLLLYRDKAFQGFFLYKG